MTALCGGGTSGPKTGAAAVVDYSAGLLAAIFAARGAGWLIPIIPFVGLAPLTLATFCAADPPAVPTFTSAETNALLQLKFGADFDSGLSKLKDLALYTVWNDICVCTSGALAPFTPPVMPVGTPVFQPPVPPTNAVCATTGPRTANLIGPSFGLNLNVPATYFVFKWTNTTTAAPGATYKAQVPQFFSPPGGGTMTNLDAPNFWQLAPGQTDTRIITALPSVNFIRPDVTFQSGTGAGTITYSIDAYCGPGAPGASEVPCCPPDVATQASLDLLLKMVTLIQRQSVPFAYLASTAHTALSGSGTFAIQGLLGVKVDVTTLPASLGSAGASPVEHFDLGFVTFGTTDGYPQSIRIEHQAQLMLPARCSVFTTLAYDLHPGVVVTITELLREP